MAMTPRGAIFKFWKLDDGVWVKKRKLLRLGSGECSSIVIGKEWFDKSTYITSIEFVYDYNIGVKKTDALCDL